MPGRSDIEWACLPLEQLLVAPGEPERAHRRAADFDAVFFDADATELQVQRRIGPRPFPTIDLIRLPPTLLQDPAAVARMGLIAHRVVMAGALCPGSAADVLQRGVLAQWQQPGPRGARVAGFLEMVRLTVREVGAAADCPPLARFFLHMAHAALMAAALDAAAQTCPNVFTRAPLYAQAAGERLGVPLQHTLPAALGLLGSPAAMEAPLLQLQRLARRRCPPPAWPAAMRDGTRSEFAYWRAPAEITSRIAAARVMAAEGDAPAAVFYLRYAAWSLVRLAMVHRRAVEGHAHHVSFIRPECAVLPDLLAHHAPLVEPWLAVFDGDNDCDAAATEAALSHLLALREPMAVHLARCGLAIELPEWRPWRPERISPITTPEEETHGDRARPVEPAV
ncbi:hypothetical protein [Ideonella sp. BN130291]|uniref:hypothetical protein n=1 Tax=Ideonella sp. BN130291 TaxID=3112940 RepID=UPI002E26D4AF|nr:hypothetical protein [Ideonella sp. BN130291]